MASLSEKLRHFKSTFDAQTPPEVLETLNRSVSLLQQQQFLEHAVALESPLPHFKLNDLSGNSYSSQHLIAQNPLIITVIRGGWCPYCMLEMQVWQNVFQTNAEKLNIVAITPEVPDFANSMSSDNNLSFPVLFDPDLIYLESLNLVWKIDEGLNQQLLKWKIDLSERHCNSKFNLPVPATLVVDRNGLIKYRFVEENYALRAEPEDVLNVYNALL